MLLSGARPAGPAPFVGIDVPAGPAAGPPATGPGDATARPAAARRVDWHGRQVDVRPGRWIVGVDERKAARALGRKANAGLLDRVFARLDKGGGKPGPAADTAPPDRVRYGRRLAAGLALVEAADAAAYDLVLARVKRLPGFQYLEPDFVVAATDTVPDDPSFPDQWPLRNTGQAGGTPGADISAVTAWDSRTGAGDVVVAVVDTGVDTTHPDLIPNLWHNPGEVPGDGLDNDRNGFVDDVYGWNFVSDSPDVRDDNLHGTHVAGTIAAAGNNGVGVAGVSWGAKRSWPSSSSVPTAPATRPTRSRPSTTRPRCGGTSG